MTTITFQVDENLHHDFKVYCSKLDIKMGAALIIAMKIILKSNKRQIEKNIKEMN